MRNKFEQLKFNLQNLEKQGLCLAFSGGIDSALLLFTCKDMNITAVTLHSVFQTDEELYFTKDFCNRLGVRHDVVTFNPLEDDILVNNPVDRCYHCKKIFFTKIKDFAQNNNLKYILDGTNYDDLRVYRPGLKALKELDIISPFAKFQITKQEIREYAKLCGLTIYNKPSAPCIATRFPYNTRLDKNSIEKIKSAEKILKTIGFENNRVRLHNDIARIEIPPDEFNSFTEKRVQIINELKKLDIQYLTLDIEGIRSGSMDIELPQNYVK